MCLYFFHLLWPSTISKRQATTTTSTSSNTTTTEQDSDRAEQESQGAPDLLLIGTKHQDQEAEQSCSLKLWLCQFWTSCFSATKRRHHQSKTGRLDEQDILLPLLSDSPNSNSNNNNNNSNNSGGQHYASNILDSFRPPLLGDKETGASKRADNIEILTSMSGQQETEQIAGANLEAATKDRIVAASGPNGANNVESVANGQQGGVFRIRTANRRHLDFDGEYDLADTKAPARSRWSGPFHFIQAADCQFGMIDSYVHKRTEPGWREEIELCERLVALCNRMQPRPLFIIICGDLIDSLPASQIGREQVVDFKRIFAKLDQRIPLVCVCGNHDVGDEPTSETVAQYRQTFGEDYFYFTKNDILFIVINSQFYQHREFVSQEAEGQDEWLEALLAKCRLFKYSFVFEHIPWFLETPDEENDYFNIRKEVRMGWLRKFKDAGVTKIMCGHYHRNAGGWFEGMELVVTTAIGAQCGSDQSGIRIVKVFDDTIEHKYYPMQDVPLNIELKKEKKENEEQQQ